MRISQIFETMNSGQLAYHATSLESISNILSSNALRSDTEHLKTDLYPELKRNEPLNQQTISGVSLTRDKLFAEAWSDVILVIDLGKLKQTYKIKQVAFYGDDVNNNREESEEFVIGSIKNLYKYLVGIYFPKRLENKYLDWKWVQKNIKPYEQEFTGWKEVLENPKYIGKPLMNAQTKKSVGEALLLAENGRIVQGVNTPPGITVDHTKKMAAAFGNIVNKDGYPPQMPTNGIINKTPPKEKDHASDDAKSMFGHKPDLTPWTNYKGKDIADA